MSLAGWDRASREVSRQHKVGGFFENRSWVLDCGVFLEPGPALKVAGFLLRGNKVEKPEDNASRAPRDQERPMPDGGYGQGLSDDLPGLL